MLGIVAAAIIAKKKCKSALAVSSLDDKEGPDASDILEGDHETNSTITSIIEMTDDAKRGKAVYVERMKYIPSGIIEIVPPPAAIPTETNDNVTGGSAIV